jgi:PAS domain S-box-containing protein
VAASALRRRTSEHRARLEAELIDQRNAHERRLAEREEALDQTAQERDTLRQSLEAARGEFHELSAARSQEREDFERATAQRDADLQQLSSEHAQTLEALDHLRAAFNTLERVSSEHALERARLESVVADRDALISAQESAHLAAEQTGKAALRQAEDALRQAVDTRNSEVASLEQDLAALRRELEEVRVERDALRREAEQLPIVRRQLDGTQQEVRRQFEYAPHAMCRVTPQGALVAVNRALARLLGYRSIEEVLQLDLEGAVFEAPADLRWLTEHATRGGSVEPVETVWKRKDRTRLTVRLRILTAREDWIEVSAEDITHLRATEENLRHARRMEAVGRLASEVAVTCDTLLRGVSHNGQQWLSAIGSDPVLRQQGEQIFGDVIQATSLLQRLAAYGNEQSSAVEPVNLPRVLRNLEPVLKRVAGEDVELVLPKSIPPFSIDVERGRVERVLVNVASYARERMPHGGRVKIDFASTMVDRAFLARFPNVRPGRHVIATITEERSASADQSTVAEIDAPARPAGTKSGVDLSVLVRLLRDCGGHLWVTAEPTGNMLLKIHLPLRAGDDPIGTQSSALPQPNRGRSLTRWFRH